MLILREVLAWKADEVATLLDTTVASVNSALQRARATLAYSRIRESEAADPLDADQAKLLEQYLTAFEAYDISRLTTLLHEDAVLSMPPFDLWLQGHADIAAWHLNQGIGCKGSRLIPTTANGIAGLRPVPAGRLGEGPHPVGAPGAGDLRRQDRRAQRLPGHRPVVPALRPPRAARRVLRGPAGHVEPAAPR